MRTRTITRKVPGTHTRGGITVPVIREEQVTVPVPPRDWDAIILRVVVGIVIALTGASVVWSTASIARLLDGGLPGYAAAAVFDISWIATLGIAFLVRHQPDRRSTVDRIGWAFTAAAVTAIGIEGWRTGGVAVAAIGAAVSLIAKVLLWTLDRATRTRLSSDDEQWLDHQLSAAGAQIALAAVRRRLARVQARGAAELAALAVPAGPDPDRPRGSTQVDLDPPQVDPTPALESTPARPDPAPTAQVTAPQVDPGSTPGRPDLHAVPDQVDPADLDRARTIVAQLRADGVAPSTEQIRRRMGIGRDRARALWLAIQADEADPARRTA